MRVDFTIPENAMRLTYQAILDDPTLLERIEEQARRERAKAVRELIVLPITRLLADQGKPEAYQHA
jgi:hypothetical protein